MKRLISILLTLTLVLSLMGGLGVSAFADEGETEVAVSEETAPAPAAETPVETSDETPAQTLDETPTETPEETTGETSEETPEETTGETPEGTTEETPEETAGESEPAPQADSAYTAANGFVVGQNYIIGIQKSDGFYAMSNDGGTVKAVVTDINAPADSVIWNADSSDGGVSLINNGAWLLYGDSTVGTRSNNAAKFWVYGDGTMSYTSRGTTYYVGDVADGQFACGTDITPATVVIYTDGSDLGTASSGGGSTPPSDPPPTGGDSNTYEKANAFEDGKTYLIGIEKDGKFYAMSNDGGKIVAKETDIKNPADSVIWTATVGSQGALLENGGIWLLYGSPVTTRDSGREPANWSFSDGVLSYDQGGKVWNVSGIDANNQFDSGIDATPATVVIYAAGSGSSSGGDSGDDSDSGFNQQTKPFDADGIKAVFLTEDFRPLMFRDGALVVEDNPLEVTGEANSYHLDSAPPPNQFTVWAAGPNMTLAADDRGTSRFIYVDENGTLQIAAGDDGTIQNWQKDTGPGSTDCVLGYKVGGTTYYAKIVNNTVTFTTNAAEASTIYTLTGSGATSGGPGGGPGGASEIPATDSAGPQIVREPEVYPYQLVDTDYAAPKYDIEVALPEGSTAKDITFKWYVDGEVASEVTVPANGRASYTNEFVAETLKGLKDPGVHPVYCEVSCDVDGETHSNTSITVNFIVCRGVQENSFLTFSDVHETFSNIGNAINDLIKTHGLIPALIICTGDWANGHYMDDSESNFLTTLKTYIARLFAQVGGIDIVFVSGNHDNGAAAAEATKDADLGAADDFDGVGVIYDSSKAENAKSSADTDGLIVFGINYDWLKVDGGYSYENVLPKLEKFFEDLAKNYNGELVVISAHAGLHKLDDWGGNNDYNVDRSDEMVELINKYAETMDIMFFFGHDHSKGESELKKLPGDSIESTVSYANKTTKTQTLKFTYAHAGYISKGIGSADNRYSYVEWNDETITRDMFAVGGDKVEDQSFEIKRVAQPSESDPGETEPSATPGQSSGPRAPKTGDESNIVVWCAIMVLCAGSLAVVLPRRKNHN